MSDNTNKHIKLIRALLAKAAGTNNPHEAEMFLAKAHQLMERHQLDAADLETDDPVGGETYYEKGSTKAAPDWDFMLVFETAKYFGCKTIRVYGKTGKWNHDLVGRESARITTIEMHKYLVVTVRRLAREAVGSREFRKFRKGIDDELIWDGDYLNADQCARRIGNALRARLGDLADQMYKDEPGTDAGKNALVTTDRVLAVYKERHPDAKSINSAGFNYNMGGERLAGSIGLNLQAGASAGQGLLN